VLQICMHYGLQTFIVWSSHDCIIYELLRIRINPSILLLYSAAGPHTIVDGKEVVNFASANYLGLIGNEKIIVRDKFIAWQCFNIFFWEYLNEVNDFQDSCIGSLEKYGVGSCGPRGFYGTIGLYYHPQTMTLVESIEEELNFPMYSCRCPSWLWVKNS
jgi:serine palmitoyltransferase